MLRRAWRLRAAARVGAASTSAASPSSAAYAATFRTWLGPWSAAPLSSRADVPDDEQARRRTLRRAARRDLRAWRGADVTLRELRELRELEDGGGSKRRWARDWASAVFADDVGDGASYEAFVAEALRHGDGRRGPGSGPSLNEAEADTRRARHSSKNKAAGRTAAEGTRAGSGAPKGGGTRGVKYKHRRGDDRVRPEKKNASKARRSSRHRRDSLRDDDAASFDWHTEREELDADAFWSAFLRAARARKKHAPGANEHGRGFGDDFRRGSFDDVFFGRPSRDAFSCPDRVALGIAPGAALDMITLKSSLRAAAMKWHPDRHAGAAAKRDAEAEFKKCYDAYDALVKRL